MSSNYELGPNERPDMKRKIVVVGDGESTPSVNYSLTYPGNTIHRRVRKDVPVNRVCTEQVSGGASLQRLDLRGGADRTRHTSPLCLRTT
jgi:hypothetical protein